MEEGWIRGEGKGGRLRRCPFFWAAVGCRRRTPGAVATVGEEAEGGGLERHRVEETRKMASLRLL